MKTKTEVLMTIKNAEKKAKIIIQAALLEKESLFKDADQDVKDRERESLEQARTQQKKVLEEAQKKTEHITINREGIKKIRAQAEKKKEKAVHIVADTFEEQFL
ncbi:MAG: hypothetical protein HY832_01920 [Candidatus Aenigmarchaeota archaeon]|nr:hypothetical protein [Candidatus Aenigmarchaeota archaeon]